MVSIFWYQSAASLRSLWFNSNQLWFYQRYHISFGRSELPASWWCCMDSAVLLFRTLKAYTSGSHLWRIDLHFITSRSKILQTLLSKIKLRCMIGHIASHKRVWLHDVSANPVKTTPWMIQDQIILIFQAKLMESSYQNVTKLFALLWCIHINRNSTINLSILTITCIPKQGLVSKIFPSNQGVILTPCSN